MAFSIEIGLHVFDAQQFHWNETRESVCVKRSVLSSTIPLRGHVNVMSLTW
jgi:hypothetical protein